jgi:FKBP-type peptidyl-prolyl cis-trans isomerase
VPVTPLFVAPEDPVRRSTALLAALAVTASLTLAACGDDSGSDVAATPEPTSAACTESPTLPAASDEVGEAPEIAKPEGAPPCDLVVEDLVEGDGDAVSDATTAYLWNYEGVSWSTGEVFDSSFQRGQAIPFSLNQVIPGWTEGLQGMKEGGRRLLVIPPDQAYGEAGSPPAIGPNETLVFVVDLVGPAS